MRQLTPADSSSVKGPLKEQRQCLTTFHLTPILQVTVTDYERAEQVGGPELGGIETRSASGLKQDDTRCAVVPIQLPPS